MTKQRLVRLDALKLCLWLVKKKQFDQLQVSDMCQMMPKAKSYLVWTGVLPHCFNEIW